MSDPGYELEGNGPRSMDSPQSVERDPSGSAPQDFTSPGFERAPSNGGAGGVDARLATIERRLDEIGTQLEALNSSVEESVRRVVAGEMGQVATDLRHTVSDLGRLLVRDLGRLNQILSTHRDAILADLSEVKEVAASRSPATSSPPPSPESGTGEPDGDGSDDSESERRRTAFRRRAKG